jgi:hypothetical protein
MQAGKYKRAPSVLVIRKDERSGGAPVSGQDGAVWIKAAALREQVVRPAAS